MSTTSIYAGIHRLESKHGVKVCKSCGAALHRNGNWWLHGLKSTIEPPCDDDREGQSKWRSEAIDPGLDPYLKNKF